MNFRKKSKKADKAWSTLFFFRKISTRYCAIVLQISGTKLQNLANNILISQDYSFARIFQKFGFFVDTLLRHPERLIDCQMLY